MTDSSMLAGNAPELDLKVASIGMALLRLQARAADPARQPSWVNRRVDHLEFLDTRAVCWQVSIDFNVPERAPRIYLGDDVLRLVPITSLAKTSLVRFSLRDEQSAAVWMPTSQETAHYLASALVYWASQNLGLKPTEVPLALVQDLKRIVSGDPREFWSRPPALLAVAALIDANHRYRRAVRKYKETRPQREGGTPLSPLRLWYERQLQCERAERELGEAAEVLRQATRRCRGLDPDIRPLAYRLMARRDFRNRVEELAQNFVVYVGIKSSVGTRRIIKLTYESHAPRHEVSGGLLRQFRQSLGWRLWQFDVLSGGRGGSYHLEVAAPPGVDLVGISAVRYVAPEPKPDTESDPGKEHRPDKKPAPRKGWWRRFKAWWHGLVFWEPAADVSVPGRLPHVHIIPPDGAYTRYRTAIFVRVSRPGWLFASWLVALVIGAVIVVGRLNLQAFYSKGTAANATTAANAATAAQAGTAAVLLLTLLGVFATMLARPGEHPLASRLLRTARGLILLDALVVLVGVGNLVLHQHPIPATVWTVLMIVACTVFALFSISLLTPVALPPRRE
jgi:hypothetical protein